MCFAGWYILKLTPYCGEVLLTYLHPGIYCFTLYAWSLKLFCFQGGPKRTAWFFHVFGSFSRVHGHHSTSGTRFVKVVALSSVTGWWFVVVLRFVLQCFQIKYMFVIHECFCIELWKIVYSFKLSVTAVFLVTSEKYPAKLC